MICHRKSRKPYIIAVICGIPDLYTEIHFGFH